MVKSKKKSGNTLDKTLDLKYRLILFINNDEKKSKALIDIVPTDWLYWDEDFEVIKVKFMPEESYNSTENLKLLKNMVINCDRPCNTWPSYPVEIRGRARTYEEAEELVDKLQYQPYAYSSDNVARAKQKAKADEDFIKNSKRYSAVDKADNLLDGVNLNLSAPAPKCLDSEKSGKAKRRKKSRVSEEFSSGEKSDRRKRKRVSSGSEESSESISSEEDIVENFKNTKKFDAKKNLTEDDSNSEASTTSPRKTNLPEQKHISKCANKYVQEKLDETVTTGTSFTSNNQITSESDKEYPQIYIDREILTQVLSQLLVPLIKEQQKFGSQLSSLSKTVNDMKGNLIDTRRICENTSAASIIEVEFDSEDIKLPCSDLTEFEKFEKKLTDTPSYLNKIACKLTSMVNTSQALIRSVTPMMRFIMSRNLALMFNLKKPNSRSVNVFITTKSYELIKGVIVKKFSKSSDDPLPDATVNNSLQSVLNHCGDWEGGRSQRKKKQPKNHFLGAENLMRTIMLIKTTLYHRASLRRTIIKPYIYL